jgi:hypothetical protein
VTTEAEQTRFAILQFAGQFLAGTMKDGKKPTLDALLVASRLMADFVFEPRATMSKDGPKLIPFEGAGQRFETGEKPPTPAQ